MPINDPTLLRAVTIIRRIINEEREKLPVDVWSQAVHFLSGNGWLTTAPQLATECEVANVR